MKTQCVWLIIGNLRLRSGFLRLSENSLIKVSRFVGGSCPGRAISALNLVIEALARVNVVKIERFACFRRCWLAFLAATAFRSFLIGCFMIMLLTLF